MNYLRKHDIRNIAEKVVEAYKEQTHVTSDIFTMNIETLVDLLGFELIKIKFGEESDVLGLQRSGINGQRWLMTKEMRYLCISPKSPLW